MQDFIKINERDNVAVALRDISAGEILEVPASPQTALQYSAVYGTSKTSARENTERSNDRTGAMAGSDLKQNMQRDAEGAAGAAAQPCGRQITALEDIPAGHKMAIRDIPAGGKVIKYGYPIGNAKETVRAGSWIHTHNLGTALGDILEYEYRPVWEAGPAEEGRPVKRGSVFRGFRRPDGRAGVRNEIWIIPTVGCVNNVATAIARQANDWLADLKRAKGSFGFFGAGASEDGGRDAQAACFGGGAEISEVAREVRSQVGAETGTRAFGTAGETCSAACHEGAYGDIQAGTVDEVIAFPHPYGCSQMGEDQEYTRRILTDLVKHPNAGGVLVLGLGCENSNIDVLKPYIGPYDEDRVKFLVSQDCRDEVAQGLETVKGLIKYAAGFQREPISASELVVGMKCGGSDGLSGITANPLVGCFSDRLVAMGGTTILTEVPEMFGAETILMNRCANEELFHQTVALINDFKNYFKSHGQTIYENPSPGNKKGGISTLEDKSLGCTQKSGSALVQGVVPYGGRVETKGLNLLSAPGNDLVAATALAAAGAQIVLFTTGRGTPFASPVPTVKISTNSALAGKKSNWIDFNAGVLVEDGSMERETEELFAYVLEVASGRKVRSEEAGYHDMAIFKQGVTL